MYVAKERLHITKDGKVVKPNDPQSARLLINKGGEMSDAEARKYGLMDDPSKSDEVMPLDAPSKPAANILQTNQNASPFAEQINFGKSPTAPVAPEPPIQHVAQDLPRPAVEQPVANTEPETPSTGMAIPPDFPHHLILVSQGVDTMGKIFAATRESLIALNFIGSARADEIIAAREKLQAK